MTATPCSVITLCSVPATQCGMLATLRGMSATPSPPNLNPGLLMLTVRPHPHGLLSLANNAY